ncbi:MAG: DNA cytosine methyltransferase [Desulfobulbaceae bacterium]|jgi:DNA (cytosine-5)-methyltransferase 1|nr:DNA cytosine methyltransferase [Desulfobulbaceae bacterium]
MRSIELFAGAGGLAMGIHLAGFMSDAVIEWDKWACDTIRENQRRGNPLVAGWPLHEQDVRLFDFSSIKGELELVAGGPPCQPFSLGGKHKAHSDKRDMFPTTIDTVRQLRPKAFLVENVKGLTRAAFANYLQYTILQLSYPDLARSSDENWLEHLSRLEKEKTSGKLDGLIYDVIFRVVNAADYGIPQRRERVFIVGFRHDLGVRWSFPETTHSLDGLLYSQWISGEYWDHHKISRTKRGTAHGKHKDRVEKLRQIDAADLKKPWRTVRDALRGLPDPRNEAHPTSHNNHIFQPGARIYAGHTGSPLDFPAKTLKAGDHGVPGGENMLVTPDGDARYFTVRESARLQTFPDSYVFHGSWTETMRQLGNAVPVALAHIMAAGIAGKLIESETQRLTTKIRQAA